MAAYLAPGRLPVSLVLSLRYSWMDSLEVRIFRSCTPPQMQQTLRDLLVSAFLFIRSTRRSRAPLFGTENTRQSRWEITSRGQPTMHDLPGTRDEDDIPS